MKLRLIAGAALAIVAGTSHAQDLTSKNVPEVVKHALSKKYPEAAKVSREKEKGNYEAN